MKKLVVLVAVAAVILLVPAGCVMSLAVAGAALTADPTSAACTSTDTGTPLPCDDGSGLLGVAIDPSSIPAPDPQSAIAVAAALTAVGRHGRYVAEGNGPVDFDCSGLTAWAWRQAGVSIDDYSYTQWNQTARIPRDAVQPGDLVFWFGGSVHHVAIVTAVSGGQVTIAEAANPESGLDVRLLGGSWDDAYLTGFGRVVHG